MSRKRSGKSSKSTSSPPRRSPPAATLSNEAVDFDQPLAAAPWSPWSRAFVIALFVWVFTLGVTPMVDTDIWWHLKTAELMWERGTVPQTDWFTYVDWDQPWIDLHWGFQLLMLAIYNLAGVPGLVLSKAAALTAAVAIGWFATGMSLSPTVRALCWLAPIVCMSGRALERPEMLSLIFLAYWLWVIPRLDERPRLIWTLPLVQLVWVNVHALFVLGLVVGGCYVADRLVRGIIGGRFGATPVRDRIPPLHLFRAGVLTLLACFINPYFEEGAFFPATLYRKFSVDQAVYGEVVGEFRSPLMHYQAFGLTNVYLIAELLVFCITLISFLALLIRRKKWSPYRVLLFAGFSHLAWEASRNTNIFSLVSAVMLLANVEDLMRTSKTEADTLTKWWHVCPRCDLASFIIVCGLIVSVCTDYWGQWTGERKSFSWNELPHWYMHDAAKFAGQAGMPAGAYVSNFGQAAVYEFHNAPERQTFMDGRLEVARISTFQADLSIGHLMAAGERTWEEIVRMPTGELPVVMLAFDSRFRLYQIDGMLRNRNWRLVYADRSGVVFVTQAVADRLKLPEVDLRSLLPPPSDNSLDAKNE